MNIWNVIHRTAVILLGILILLTAILMAIPKFVKYHHLQDDKKVREQTKVQREEELRELQYNQEQFRTDDQFLIDTARDAGMVRSNEVVYKFTNVPSNARSP